MYLKRDGHICGRVHVLVKMIEYCLKLFQGKKTIEDMVDIASMIFM